MMTNSRRNKPSYVYSEIIWIIDNVSDALGMYYSGADALRLVNSALSAYSAEYSAMI